MNKYKKLGVGILAVMGVVAIGTYFISYIMDTKTPETDYSIEEIVEKNKGNLDTEVSTYSSMQEEDIYIMIHEMANTLIVAEDGLIYGQIPINDNSINKAMAVVSHSTTIDEDEKLVFMNILQDWREKNFSGGVRAHNYAWKRLNGTIGRAKDLRKEYK